MTVEKTYDRWQSKSTAFSAVLFFWTKENYNFGRKYPWQISSQKLILQKYANEHSFHNCQFYVDDSYSGANFNRPAYKKMMDDIYEGKIGTVIVKDQSRLRREYLQTGMLMEITFPQYDVRFIAINDGVDSLHGESDFSGIKNYFNDLYARDTSKKILIPSHSFG